MPRQLSPEGFPLFSGERHDVAFWRFSPFNLRRLNPTPARSDIERGSNDVDQPIEVSGVEIPKGFEDGGFGNID